MLTCLLSKMYFPLVNTVISRDLHLYALTRTRENSCGKRRRAPRGGEGRAEVEGGDCKVLNEGGEREAAASGYRKQQIQAPPDDYRGAHENMFLAAVIT